ncbi:MAG: TonB-dependent receptor [Flectobacillus sp.]|uniref:TonB-dependent receptor n=1 Tax=Flectobacillus sp. TaxID=50419 RepID=UPI003B9B44C2
MKNIFTKSLLVFGLMLFAFVSTAQTKISGKVTDASTNEVMAGVNIMIRGKVTGTTTNLDGTFTLYTQVPLPFKLAISFVGYKTQEIVVTDSQAKLDIAMVEQVIQGEEVVVSAARVEESVMKSPVTIEKIDIRTIQANPSFNFLESLKYLKGVDYTTQSMSFTSINARGFNANGNNRLVQLVDGMDNQAPGTNFSVGTIVVTSDIDLASAEFLPGAASALYGPNALNGILLMNTKSPFLYKGLSANLKTGMMHESNRSQPNSPFYDFSMRWAQSFNDKFAMKVNFWYIGVPRDWAVSNTLNMNDGLTGKTNRMTDPNYNGVNVYGDEVSQDLRSIADKMVAANLLPASTASLIPYGTLVSRTGYNELDLVKPEAKNIRTSMALHYRLTENIEAIGQFMYGSGTSVYMGSDRYSLNNFSGIQAKLELKGSNFYVRGYTTQERSGDTFATGVLAQILNESWGGGSTAWYPTYVGAYLKALQSGNTSIAAHNQARGVADAGRPLPGSAVFNALTADIKNVNIAATDNISYPYGGAHLYDKTNMYQLEGMYNFKNEMKFAEVIVGGNYRMYDLNSGGTFYPDKDGKGIQVNEWGAYVQATKSFFDEKLKIVASSRYDKNQNFDGQFSPRLAAVVSPWKEHSFRASYQTGFRIPTIQSQYVDIKAPQAIVIGGLGNYATKYGLNSSTNPAYTLATVRAFGTQIQERATALAPSIATGLQAEAQANPQAFANKYGVAPSAASIADLTTKLATQQGTQAALASGVLKPYEFKPYKPEIVQTYELGYRGLIANTLYIDASYYYNQFKNFAYQETLIQSTTGTPVGLLSESTRQIYSMPASSQGKAVTEGFAAGIDYRLPKGFLIGGNISYNSLKEFDQNIIDQGGTAAFNTPKFKYSASIANRELGKSGIGFNVIWRYQDAFLWQSGIVAGYDSNATIVPAISTFDAQVSKKISSLKSILKLGATNILGKSYFTAYGNPNVGSTYFLSLTFDELTK